jgi:hypothetical protein
MLFSSHELLYRFGKILFFSCKNTAFTPYIFPDVAGHHKEKVGDFHPWQKEDRKPFGLTADAIKEAASSSGQHLQGRRRNMN